MSKKSSGQRRKVGQTPASPRVDRQTPWIDVSSLRDVYEEAGALQERLERTWSEALDTEEAREARQQQAQVLSSLSAAIVRRTEDLSAWLHAHHFNPAVQAFPLDKDGMSRLSNASSSEAVLDQLRTASLYTLQSFLEAAGALTEKSIVELGGVPLQRRTWWEAGAFSLMTRRGDVLMRVQEETDRAQQAIENGKAQADIATWHGAINRAALIAGQGFPEAALPFILQAARLMVADRLKVPVQSLPPSLVAVLTDAGPPAEELAQPIELLEGVCTRLGVGEPIDVGPAVCLAFGLPPLLIPALSAIEPVRQASIELERA
jgi:hypothetical protein